MMNMNQNGYNHHQNNNGYNSNRVSPINAAMKVGHGSMGLQYGGGDINNMMNNNNNSNKNMNNKKKINNNMVKPKVGSPINAAPTNMLNMNVSVGGPVNQYNFNDPSSMMQNIPIVDQFGMNAQQQQQAHAHPKAGGKVQKQQPGSPKRAN